MSELPEKRCRTCGGIKNDGYVTDSHFFESDCIRELKAQFNSYLERTGGDIQPDGSITLSSEGYGLWTRRKGDERTRDIAGENIDLRREIERLKAGDFTEQEFNALCHNLHLKDEPITPQAFCDGCEEYQVKLFGESPIANLRAEIDRLKGEVAELRANPLYVVTISSQDAREARAQAFEECIEIANSCPGDNGHAWMEPRCCQKVAEAIEAASQAPPAIEAEGPESVNLGYRAGPDVKHRIVYDFDERLEYRQGDEFEELVITNPETGEQRILLLPKRVKP